MLKWMLRGLALLLCAMGIWYFFIKSYDYKISFRTSAAPGTIYLRALHWKPETATAINKIPYESLVQKVDTTPTEIKWDFTPVNDSITLVQVHSKTLEANFLERLKLLLTKTDQQKKFIAAVKSFRNLIEKDKELFDISIQGEAVIPQTLCACIPLESKMEEKATGMMKNISLLHDYISLNKLELKGNPRVIVTSWDTSTNKIEFDFCFPLNKKGEIFKPEDIIIKKIPSQKALKAIFHGNYIFSHHAWLKLLNYAEINGYEIAGFPLEVFIDNPALGGDSRDWKAEIFLPVKP